MESARRCSSCSPSSTSAHVTAIDLNPPSGAAPRVPRRGPLRRGRRARRRRRRSTARCTCCSTTRAWPTRHRRPPCSPSTTSRCARCRRVCSTACPRAARSSTPRRPRATCGASGRRRSTRCSTSTSPTAGPRRCEWFDDEPAGARPDAVQLLEGGGRRAHDCARRVPTMRRGVRTNAVCPGPIDTPLLPEFRQTTSDKIVDWNIREMGGRAVSPREVATVLAFLGLPAASYVERRERSTSTAASTRRWQPASSTSADAPDAASAPLTRSCAPNQSLHVAQALLRDRGVGRHDVEAVARARVHVQLGRHAGLVQPQSRSRRLRRGSRRPRRPTRTPAAGPSRSVARAGAAVGGTSSRP